MQLNHLPKRKFEDYTTNSYPPLPQDAQAGLMAPPDHNPYAHHAALAQQQPLHSLHPLAQQTLAPSHNYAETQQDLQPPQSPVAGKAKKPRKKREKKPRKDRKKKEEESKPKVLFRGSRFELWLETRFEEELLKLFDVPALQFSANLVNATSSVAPGASWEMTRSDEERMYKEKWRKRYHVYSAVVGDLVGDTFNFHIRTKNVNTGEYNKLPFITPDRIMNSPLSSYSNYLSLLGGAHISPGDDHGGYPPGEHAGEEACTLYEGSDVSFVLVGHLAGPNPAAPAPAAPAGLHRGFPSDASTSPSHAAALHAAYSQGPHHQQVPTDGNHP